MRRTGWLVLALAALAGGPAAARAQIIPGRPGTPMVPRGGGTPIADSLKRRNLPTLQGPDSVMAELLARPAA